MYQASYLAALSTATSRVTAPAARSVALPAAAHAESAAAFGTARTHVSALTLAPKSAQPTEKAGVDNQGRFSRWGINTTPAAKLGAPPQGGRT